MPHIASQMEFVEILSLEPKDYAFFAAAVLFLLVPLPSKQPAKHLCLPQQFAASSFHNIDI
jgi:hypothetical protein